jgi:hypothetical protein
MPARNPRVNVVLEKPLYEAVDHLAKEEGRLEIAWRLSSGIIPTSRASISP